MLKGKKQNVSCLVLSVEINFIIPIEEGNRSYVIQCSFIFASHNLMFHIRHPCCFTLLRSDQHQGQELYPAILYMMKLICDLN